MLNLISSVNPGPGQRRAEAIHNRVLRRCTPSRRSILCALQKEFYRLLSQFFHPPAFYFWSTVPKNVFPGFATKPGMLPTGQKKSGRQAGTKRMVSALCFLFARKENRQQ